MTATRLLVPVALLFSAGTAQAELNGSIGFLSDYVFRGVHQSDSTAHGGLEFTAGGFFVGTWAADVGQGLETDLYGGYAGEVGEFGYTIGYTGYFYTDDFDDTYQELNFKGSYGPFNVTYNAGRYENFDGPTLDYGFTTMGIEFDHVHGLVGMFSEDFDGEYLEVGYATEISGIDLGLDLIYSDADLAGGRDETTLVFSIGKTFGLID